MALVNSYIFPALNNKLTDSGWISDKNYKYRRVNGIVFISESGGINTAGNFMLIGTLPEGFRPSQVIYTAGVCGSSGRYPLYVEILTDGKVYADGLYEYGRFTAAFPVE